MPTAIYNANNGSRSSYNNVTADSALLANMLVEQRVTNMLLLSLLQGQAVDEELPTLRNDVITEVPW